MFRPSESVILLPSYSRDVCKDAIAFANSRGGAVYIGVRTDGTVAGLPDAETVASHLSVLLHSSVAPNIMPFSKIKVLTYVDRQIISLTVQKGSYAPYFLLSEGLVPSGVYVRDGDTTVPCSQKMINGMIVEADGYIFEEKRSVNQKITFETALNLFVKSKCPHDSAAKRQLGITKEGGIFSNLALLISDQCGSNSVITDFRENANAKPIELTGSLLKQAENAVPVLINAITEKKPGQLPFPDDSYPEDALREAFVTMLLQRDYSVPAPASINIFEDRLEFICAGKLPKGTTLDDLLLGLPLAENQKLAALFAALGLTSAYGNAIPRIAEEYKESDRKPKFEVASNSFKIILYKYEYKEEILPENIIKNIEEPIDEPKSEDKDENILHPAQAGLFDEPKEPEPQNNDEIHIAEKPENTTETPVFRVVSYDSGNNEDNGYEHDYADDEPLTPAEIPENGRQDMRPTAEKKKTVDRPIRKRPFPGPTNRKKGKTDEEKILDFIRENGYIVRADVEQLLDVSQATSNRLLRRLMKEGKIYPEGQGRRTKYLAD